MAMGFENIKLELIRSMNEQDFDYVEGLVEVETYISEYLLIYGHELTSFISEELDGSRQHLRIWCQDVVYQRSYYMEFTVYQ